MDTYTGCDTDTRGHRETEHLRSWYDQDNLDKPRRSERDAAKRLAEGQMREAKSTDPLLEFLHDLPLAIRQASDYIQKTGMTTTQYRHHCQSSDLRFVEWLSRDSNDRGRYRGIKFDSNDMVYLI